MTRHMLVFAVLAAAAGCASTGAYSPRPFPGAPAPAEASIRTSPAAPAAVRAGTAAVLATALDLRGTPYRLGGADPSGFDCSGFVQYVLRQHAVDMPRTVAEQFQVGARTRDIAPGDLVFFQTEGSSASHVGIAIDGESFVHAPNSRGVVRVERLDSSYWSARFIGARRVF
ncbi:MAG TPA: C40 family peptidase [Vicinamibacterales bacterium]